MLATRFLSTTPIRGLSYQGLCQRWCCLSDNVIGKDFFQGKGLENVANVKIKNIGVIMVKVVLARKLLCHKSYAPQVELCEFLKRNLCI